MNKTIKFALSNYLKLKKIYIKSKINFQQIEKKFNKIFNTSYNKLNRDDILKADICAISYLDMNLRPSKWNKYYLDKNLSNKHITIYFNKKIKLCIVSIRGTKITSKSDLYSDKFIIFNKMKNDDRFIKSKKIILEIIKQYKDFTLEFTGHSLGGSLTLFLTNLNKKYINKNTVFNPGLSFYKGDKIIKKYIKLNINRFIIKLGDPISNIIIKYNPKNIIYIKNKIYKNFIKNHKLDNFISKKMKNFKLRLKN